MSRHFCTLEARRLMAVIGGAGTVDTTFNGTGSGTVTFGSKAITTLYNTVVEPDGKVILVGAAAGVGSGAGGTDIAIARLNKDATLDTSFGYDFDTATPGGGTIVFRLDSNLDAAYGAVVDAQGRILVVGALANLDSSSAANTYSRAFLVRLTSAGLPDVTLDGGTGSPGIVFPTLSSDAEEASEARSVAVQSDGKIVVAGAGNIKTLSAFALTRFNVDGTVDTTFGDEGTGLRITSDPEFYEKIFEVVVNPDDSMFLTGTAIPVALDSVALSAFVVAKVDANGLDDASFGDGGAVAVGFPLLKVGKQQFDRVLPVSTTLAVQEDGKVVVGGTVINIDENAPAGKQQVTAGYGLARFTADGLVDNSFGKKGVVTSYFGNPAAPAAAPIANQVTVLPNKTILVVGRASVGDATFTDFGSVAVMRFTTTGALDKGFNRTGQLLIANTPELSPASPGDEGTLAGAFGKQAATAAVVPGGGILLLASGADATVKVTRLIADGADLVTSIPAVPVAVATGSSGMLAIKLTNQGSVGVNTKVPITVRFSQDQVYDESDASAGTVLMKVSLGAGAQKTFLVPFSVPGGGGGGDGSFFVVGAANESQVLVESDYLNNTAVAEDATDVVAPFVDLSAVVVSGPGGIKAGKGGTFSIRLTNDGNSAAVGSVVLQLLASLDETESGEDVQLLLKTAAAVKLGAGASVVVKIPAKVPGGTARGSYKLILKVNSSAIPLATDPTRSSVEGALVVS